MPRLLQNERERAVGMFQDGMTHTEIANNVNCSIMTIYRLLVRVRATGTTSDRRRSGRPRDEKRETDVTSFCKKTTMPESTG
jgi:transposase